MINSSLKIASVSLPVVWADKKANIDAVSDIMAGIRKDTDLVVLPELFSTAFVPDPDVQMRRRIAERPWINSRNLPQDTVWLSPDLIWPVTVTAVFSTGPFL